MGLQEMAKYVGGRGGAGTSKDAWKEASAVAYRQRVIMVKFPEKDMGKRNYRELVTISEAIDALLVGNLARVGDHLMQRMKATEMSVVQKGWDQAKHLEVIPEDQSLLTSASERDVVAKAARRAARLRTQLEASWK